MNIIMIKINIPIIIKKKQKKTDYMYPDLNAQFVASIADDLFIRPRPPDVSFDK